MRSNRWMILMVGLLACGLIAAGCGSDNSTTTPAATTTSDATSTTEATTSDDTSTTESTTSDDTASTGGATADDVYQACLDAIAGTPAESTAKPSCEQAKAAFEQCAQQAASAGGDAGDSAAAICQSAADEAIKQLEAAGSAG